jgi:hypothetical protein
MRKERITYIGAYHHVMNRGYNGNDIFAGNTEILVNSMHLAI